MRPPTVCRMDSLTKVARDVSPLRDRCDALVQLDIAQKSRRTSLFNLSFHISSGRDIRVQLTVDDLPITQTTCESFMLGVMLPQPRFQTLRGRSNIVFIHRL